MNKTNANKRSTDNQTHMSCKIMKRKKNVRTLQTYEIEIGTKFWITLFPYAGIYLRYFKFELNYQKYNPNDFFITDYKTKHKIIEDWMNMKNTCSMLISDKDFHRKWSLIVSVLLWYWIFIK